MKALLALLLAGGLTGCAVTAPPRVISLPDGTTLKQVKEVTPEYPEYVRRAGLQGVVEIAYSIEKDGSVSNLAVVRSAHPTLDRLGLDAVAQWRYEPSAERPRVRLTVPLTFTIHKR